MNSTFWFAPWFNPFFWGGAVFLYVVALKLWQPQDEAAMKFWRVAALALAVAGAYWLHMTLFPPVAVGGTK
jgi:hypothetical protein